MVQAVVAVGGNVGDVRQTLRRAQTLVEQDGSVQSVQSAELYRSVAMGADAGDAFLNSAWVLDASLEPLELLDLLQRVENELGRTRKLHWGPRTLDLDLIFYDEEQIDSPRLTVPHPHCWYRRFVLAPIESLLPDLRHPVCGLTVRELLQRLSTAPFSLAMGGPSVVTKAMQSVASEFPGVKSRQVDTPGEIDVSKVSLAVWFGDSDGVELDPLWLRLPVHEAEQHLRNTLIAACTEVVLER